MSSTTHQIVLTARDQTTQVFSAIEQGARRDAAALQQMGQQGSAGLNQVDQAAAKTTAAMASHEQQTSRLKTAYQNLQGAGNALGRVTFAVGELFGEMAQFGADAQASEERLKVAVENTGHAWEDDAAAMEKAVAKGHELAFSKEDVEGALAKLVTVTKDSNTALKDLALSEDIARARGIDLSSAALAVGRAQEGNSAALARLGFVVDHTASATENLARVQQQVAGQSEAFASTTAGSVDRMKDSFHQFLAGLGNEMGPLQTWLALMPGISATGVLVSGAMGHLAEVFLRDEVAAEAAAVGEEHLAVATVAVGAAGAEAEVASAGLLATLGPLGLVAAAAAAALGIYELVKSHHDESAAAKEADKATQDLVKTLHDLNAAGSSQAGTATAWVDTLGAALDSIPAKVQKIKDEQTKITGTNQPVAIDPNDTKMAALETQLEKLNVTAAESAQVQTALNAIITDTGTGAGLAAEAAQKLFDQYGRDQDVAKLVSGLIVLASRLGDLDVKFNASRVSAVESARAIGDYADALYGGTKELTAWEEKQKVIAADAPRVRDAFNQRAINDYVNALYGGTNQLTAYEQKQIDATKAQEDAKHKTVDITKEVKAYTDGLALEAKTAYDAAVALGVLSTVAERLHPIDLSVSGGDRAVGTAADLQRTGAALDSVLGIFGVLDTMASKGKQAGTIADNLVGKPGQWAQIDSLLKNGEISLTRYHETIAAGYSLEKRQAEIEENLNIIRAKQLPLLNEQDKAYSDYIEKLSHLSPLQQEVALGFMDTAESAKAQQAVTLAASAAMGQLGDTGEATATKIIAGAAAADPVLAAMLQQIGLISVDHEGKVTVNFPNAKSLNSDIEGLSASIDALTVALGGVPPLTKAEVDMIGDPIADAAAVLGLQSALAGLDGMTATATVNNVTNNVTNSINNQTTGGTFATGGLVSAAGGRMTGMEYWPMRVNEGGRETATLPTGDTVWLPSGSTVWPHAASMEGNRRGGGVSFVFNHYGDVHGFPDLDAFFAAAERSARAHFAGAGM